MIIGLAAAWSVRPVPGKITSKSFKIFTLKYLRLYGNYSRIAPTFKEIPLPMKPHVCNVGKMI